MASCAPYLEARVQIHGTCRTGRRLTSAELLAAADKLGVDVATLRAILQVETAGAGFDAKKRLKLLFVPHIFYRQVGPGPKRDQAVKKGLAYRKARTVAIHLSLSDMIRSPPLSESTRPQRSLCLVGASPNYGF